MEETARVSLAAVGPGARSSRRLSTTQRILLSSTQQRRKMPTKALISRVHTTFNVSSNTLKHTRMVELKQVIGE